MMSLIGTFFGAILDVLDESETLWETPQMLMLMLLGLYSFIQADGHFPSHFNHSLNVSHLSSWMLRSHL